MWSLQYSRLAEGWKTGWMEEGLGIQKRKEKMGFSGRQRQRKINKSEWASRRGGRRYRKDVNSPVCTQSSHSGSRWVMEGKMTGWGGVVRGEFKRGDLHLFLPRKTRYDHAGGDGRKDKEVKRRRKENKEIYKKGLQYLRNWRFCYVLQDDFFLIFLFCYLSSTSDFFRGNWTCTILIRGRPLYLLTMATSVKYKIFLITIKVGGHSPSGFIRVLMFKAAPHHHTSTTVSSFCTIKCCLLNSRSTSSAEFFFCLICPQNISPKVMEISRFVCKIIVSQCSIWVVVTGTPRCPCGFATGKIIITIIIIAFGWLVWLKIC